MNLLSRLRGRLGPVLQSDREFIDAAYRRILGRPADPEGMQTYLAALRNGLGRMDLLLELAHSEELTLKLADTARARAGPRRLRPDRYREMVDRTNGQVIPVFEAVVPADFDWLETRILEDGYYEKPGVWNLEIDLDKRVIAEVIAAFAPRRSLELGCASGPVIECLLDLGVTAEGLDISMMALNRSSPRIRHQLRHGDLLAIDLRDPYDVVFGLDIFEHLNPNRLDSYIERIAEICCPEGFVFCNIPAFGRDPVFGTVFPYYIDGWEGDAAAGRPFSRLHVDGIGYPIHGHLTWADTRWWAAQFERVGFVREPEIERALHAKYDAYMRRITPARVSYYIFAKSPSPDRRRTIVERISASRSDALASAGFV